MTDPYFAKPTTAALLARRTPTPPGRLQTRVWARGITTTYTYNTSSPGDLPSVACPDGTPGVASTYDRRGRQKQVALGANAVTTLTYNNPGQLLSATWSGTSPLSGVRDQ